VLVGRKEEDRQEMQARLSYLENVRIFLEEAGVQARNIGSTEGETALRRQFRTTLGIRPDRDTRPVRASLP
jgi:D-Tyr-tRNAtyr deacylase